MYGRRHSKLFINCHVSWDTLYKPCTLPLLYFLFGTYSIFIFSYLYTSSFTLLYIHISSPFTLLPSLLYLFSYSHLLFFYLSSYLYLLSFYSIDFRSTFVVSPRNNIHHRLVDGWILYIYILALIWIKKLVSLGSKDPGRETFR